MSYCRWSCLNGYSDVYVYEGEEGWITHVAGMKRPDGAPLDPYEAIFDGDFEEFKRREAARDQWDNENPLFAIEHDEAGEDFLHLTPGECADNLERLAREGFVVPHYAITSLREEQEEMNTVHP